MRLSDIRGAVQLATQATTGVTRLVEGVHQSVWDRMGVPGGKTKGTTRGVTGAVYRLIKDITRVTGKSADVAIGVLQAAFDSIENNTPRSPRGETFLSVLNGVMGDSLVEDKNPFAISMSLRYQDSELDWNNPPAVPADSGKVVLLIHGLCMNDLQQHAQNRGYATEPGQLLSSTLGYCPVYVRYNSGQHISRNGEELATRLEQLVLNWPTAIDDLSVIAHSMGGLVIRSALHQAQQQGLAWPLKMKNLVFLGTPHHGAPLERAGNWLDLILDHAPYTKPFTALGQVRSAGITDLRYGNLLHEDWQDHDRFHHKRDSRRIVPLPGSINCFTVAATRAEKRSILSDHLVGDGLVPIRSALGRHKAAARTLAFPDSSRKILYRTGHMEMLNSPEVHDQVIQWLAPGNFANKSRTA